MMAVIITSLSMVRKHFMEGKIQEANMMAVIITSPSIVGKYFMSSR